MGRTRPYRYKQAPPPADGGARAEPAEGRPCACNCFSPLFLRTRLVRNTYGQEAGHIEDQTRNVKHTIEVKSGIEVELVLPLGLPETKLANFKVLRV